MPRRVEQGVTRVFEREIANRGLMLPDFCRRHRLNRDSVWRVMRGSASLRHPVVPSLRRALLKEGIEPFRGLQREERDPAKLNGDAKLTCQAYRGPRRACEVKARLGLSYAEIARETEVPRPTVHHLLTGLTVGCKTRSVEARRDARKGAIAACFKEHGATKEELRTLWWLLDAESPPALADVPAELRAFLEGGDRMLTQEQLGWFGLTRDPFVGFVGEGDQKEEPFLGRNQRRALKQLRRAVADQRLAGLVGPVGTGKTQLWRWLQAELEEDAAYRFVVLRDITQERVTSQQIAEALIDALTGRRAPVTRQRRKRALEKALTQEREQGRLVTLVIEEGQLMSDENLRTFKGLNELYEGFRKLLGVIVIAQSQLHDRLRSPAVEEVRRRLPVIPCPGLHHAEIGDYLAHRLTCCFDGRRRVLFDEGAVKTFRSRQCRKITVRPLALGNVATLAMEVAHSRNRKTVQADDAEEAFRRGSKA